jgi:hypothetical protein
MDDTDPSVADCYSNGNSQMVAGIQGLHLADTFELDVSASNHKTSQQPGGEEVCPGKFEGNAADFSAPQGHAAGPHKLAKPDRKQKKKKKNVL